MIKKSIIILGLILIIDFLLSNLILKKTKIWKYSKLIDQHWRIPSDIYHHAIKPNIDVIEPWGFSLEKRLITNSIGFRDFTNKSAINKFSTKKPKIFLFPNCFFDNPHKYRSMIFNDFYEQMKFFLDLSLKMKEYDWYYKPHPNELGKDLDIHKKLLINYPDVIYLKKNISHKQIIKSKPKCVITNHGTVAHEYASFKIPVNPKTLRKTVESYKKIRNSIKKITKMYSQIDICVFEKYA